jgi:hypothetical protein
VPAVLVDLSLAAKRDRMEGGNPGDDKLKYTCLGKGIFFKEGGELFLAN